MTRTRKVRILVGLVPLSVLVSLLLFYDAGKRYSGWAGPWPTYVAYPEPYRSASRTDHLLLLPVRTWDRRGVPSGAYVPRAQADDSPEAWAIRLSLQSLYVYGIGILLVVLTTALWPRSRPSRGTWVGTGAVFILLFWLCNMVEWPASSSPPDFCRGLPFCISARPCDTGRDSPLAGLARCHKPGLVANAAILLLLLLGVNRVLSSFTSPGRGSTTRTPK